MRIHQKRQKTIIRFGNISNPSEAMINFKEHVDITKLGGGLKGIKHTKDGALIIESHDKQQQ